SPAGATDTGEIMRGILGLQRTSRKEMQVQGRAWTGQWGLCEPIPRRVSYANDLPWGHGVAIGSDHGGATRNAAGDPGKRRDADSLHLGPQWRVGEPATTEPIARRSGGPARQRDERGLLPAELLAPGGDRAPGALPWTRRAGHERTDPGEHHAGSLTDREPETRLRAVQQGPGEGPEQGPALPERAQHRRYGRRDPWPGRPD